MPKSEREEHRRQETEKKDNDKIQILNAKSKLDRIYRIIINCWKNGIAKCLNNEILEWWNSVQKKATEFTIQEREWKAGSQRSEPQRSAKTVRELLNSY